MKSPNDSETDSAKPIRYVPAWQAIPLSLMVWWGLSWFVSLLTPRYGWAAGRPDNWNWLGLIPVVVGTIGLIWGVVLHAAQSPKGIEWEAEKSHLLKRGFYGFSRNPMYLSELILVFGWVIFYGSLAVLMVTLVWWAWFNFYQVPSEERLLEKQFGEAYLEYKKKVQRWL